MIQNSINNMIQSAQTGAALTNLVSAAKQEKRLDADIKELDDAIKTLEKIPDVPKKRGRPKKNGAIIETVSDRELDGILKDFDNVLSGAAPASILDTKPPVTPQQANAHSSKTRDIARSGKKSSKQHMEKIKNQKKNEDEYGGV